MNRRWLLTAVLLSPVSIAVYLRSGPLQPSTMPEYSPRRGFYLSHPVLLWANLGNSLLVAASYALFICGIYWLASKLKHRPELRNTLWILSALNLFFLTRLAVAVLSIVNLWWPLYNFTLALNFIAAIAAAPVAAVFVWRAPALAANIVHFFQLLDTEQQFANALRKSEAFLDRTNRIAGVGGWEVDLISGVVTWSEETYRIHGIPLDFVPTLEDGIAFYAEEARPAILSAVQDSIENGTPWDVELPVNRADGRRIWVRTAGQAEPHHGKRIRLVGTFQDITAQVDARNALRTANERIEIATDSGQIGIWDWDIVTGQLFCDDWMYRLHGKDPQQRRDDPLWRDHLHPDDKDRVVAALNDAVTGVRPYEAEFRIVWPDGSIHHLRGSARVTRAPDGSPLRMVGVNWDVTESRRLTAQLAEQHELLNVTLQAIGDGVITTDAGRNVTWLNHAAERMTGWSISDAVCEPINLVFQTLNADTREPAENPLANFIAQGNAVGIARHTLLLARDGRELGIENAVAPLRANGGRLLGNVLVFRDVTEQRNLAAETERNAQLKVQLKLRDEFLSHVSHELRSPLTSIYSFASIIEDGLAGQTSSEQKDYLHIILKNVSQLQSMIEDLLTVTQSREGKLAVEPQSLDVSEAIIDAIHTVQSSAAAKHIALSSIPCDDLPRGYADPIRLRQVLIILLDNAVKFTPHGGTIAVHASIKDSGLLLIQITDSGCGIAADKRTLVFENLYQVTGSTQPDTSVAGRTGLGLGLHIARNLVTRQGGNIWVTAAPVHGSVFNFTLPIFTAAAAEKQAPEDHPLRRKTDKPSPQPASHPASEKNNQAA
jgi:PAS domain S-box-containing protein